MSLRATIGIGMIMTQGATIPNIEPGQTIGRQTLLRLLSNWPGLESEAGEAADHSSASSFYLRPGDSLEALTGLGPEGDSWRRPLLELGSKVMKSDTGLAGFRLENRGLLVAPPFPLPVTQFTKDWDTGPLRKLLEADLTIGVVLLRLGRFSVAVYQGQKLVSSKTDARYVKGRHSAGGTSQQRFARIREGQIQRLYDKACLAVQNQFGPYMDRLQYILLGGESQTLTGFMKACPHMNPVRGMVLGRRLNVRDPKRDTLDRVGEMVWDCRVWPVEW